MNPRLAIVLLLCSLGTGCGKKDKPAVELIADLKTSQEKERIVAARLLPQQNRDANQVVPALIASLKDREADVRRSAALGLASFGEKAKDAIPALLDARKDKDARVRNAAELALSRIDPNHAAGNEEKSTSKDSP